MIILIVVCNTIAIIDTSLFIFIMVSVQIEKSSILCECYNEPVQHDRRTGVVNATARFRTYFKRVRERARNLEVRGHSTETIKVF